MLSSSSLGPVRRADRRRRSAGTAWLDSAWRVVFLALARPPLRSIRSATSRRCSPRVATGLMTPSSSPRSRASPSAPRRDRVPRSAHRRRRAQPHPAALAWPALRVGVILLTSRGTCHQRGPRRLRRRSGFVGATRSQRAVTLQRHRLLSSPSHRRPRRPRSPATRRRRTHPARILVAASGSPSAAGAAFALECWRCGDDADEFGR